MRKRTFLKAAALSAALPATTCAFAQFNTSRPIRMVVPLPAGTFLDTMARLTLTAAGKLLGQTFVVDNKPGANGTIGTMEVVRAAPDGLTLLCATNSHLATNLALMKSLPYDPRRDLTAIAGGISGAQLFLVKGNSPFRNLADFIAHAKKNPGKVSVGYSTSVVQLQIATMSKMAGIELLPVPYKGTPAAFNDLVGGVLDATQEAIGQAMPQIKSGQMKALAITAKRNPLVPDVPAASETLPGFNFPTWNAFLGPAGLPREIVNRLGTAISQVQRQPEVAQPLIEAGAPPFIISPDELKAYIEAEIVKYARLTKDAGIQPE